ncbi:hypothetical protein [Sphingobacterium yanglingense]|uniref:Uncharacterized protein n=1 Tax=Sphingobacterium yanglingense TaxID=1437280 RepID=A0A4V3DDV8_9SPHI|nr:hypothetical protein [Sphingobacterium yanglingense]TDQ78298.1 hypothetical protein CLV99_2279 [Sphingobacterium yanglingense]
MIKTGFVYLILSLNSLLLFSQSWDSLKKEKDPIFSFTVNDTLSFPIYIVENVSDKGRYYAAKLQTNVCNDQICLPIEVNLFWDLLGNFHHFSRESGFNFTKFDHQYFDESDYDKLNQILLDSLSPLRDYAVEDLLDKSEKKFSVQIDAVTRPTSKLFSTVTVPGALYTVYTLWHIVNGPIKLKLNDYTNKEYTSRKWQHYFATSQLPIYQEYFLKNITIQDLEYLKGDVINLLFAEDDFIPHYVIDILAPSTFNTPKEYNIILRRLEQLKGHVVTEILNSITALDSESKELITKYKDGSKASPKQKEIIKRILNHEVSK